MNLKYLFIAEYTDGSFHHQSPEDKSRLEPDTRSEFYDVLQSGKEIKRFSLTDGTHTVCVDLTDGQFEVNGFPLHLESEQLPTIPDTYTLIFYRQHTHSFNTKHEDNENPEEISHDVEYFIGWQTTIKGKNYQQKIGVK